MAKKRQTQTKVRAKKVKTIKAAKASKKKKTAKTAKKRSAAQKKSPREPERIYRPKTEYELTENLNEDLHEAWNKLRDFCASLGEQRIYTSERAMMFARRVCYLFVRPKKAYVEVTFFLPREIHPPEVFRLTERSKGKYEHIFKLVHGDQVEEPLTDWIREAFELGSQERPKETEL